MAQGPPCKAGTVLWVVTTRIVQTTMYTRWWLWLWCEPYHAHCIQCIYGAWMFCSMFPLSTVYTCV